MEIKPVSQKKDPKYPTIDRYIANPGMLGQHMPAKWVKNKIAATSLATFILCSIPEKESKQATLSEMAIHQKTENNKPESLKNEPKDSVQVAPVFVHGDGAGATGCIVMSPPVFISEQEALELIFGKLKEEGFIIETQNTDSISFKSDQIAISCISDEEMKKYPKVDVVIKLDGYDKTRNFAIEYVSVEDYELFAAKDNLYGCSVSQYDTKQAAEIIRDNMAKNNTMNSVVFYDPISVAEYKNGKSWEKTHKDAVEDSKKELLAQVTDFINWVKKEGLIKE